MTDESRPEVPGWEPIVHEAVERLRSNLSEEDLREVMAFSSADDFAATSHFGLGMWARNKLKLHEENSQVVRACAAASGWDSDMLFLFDPDNASSFLLKQLWHALNEEA